MKRRLLWLLAGMFAFISSQAQAEIIDRGGGLIYDTVLNVTWLQDANYAQTSGYSTTGDGGVTWNDATSWVDGLNYYDSVRNTTWSDWRLPRILPIAGGTSYNLDTTQSNIGGADNGYNMSAPGSIYAGSTRNELAYMYFNNLGNHSPYSTSGDWIGWTPSSFNASLFINLTTGDFWSGNPLPHELQPPWLDPQTYTGIWSFQFYTGFQGYPPPNSSQIHYAWAVRDGDVGAAPGTAPVPEPATVLLLGVGLAGLAGYGRKKFKK